MIRKISKKGEIIVPPVTMSNYRLRPFGIGLELFFETLKRLCIAFGVASLIAIPILY
jgi:hypothetical protein